MTAHQAYTFMSVTLNAQGEIVERRPHEAQQIAITIAPGVELELVQVPDGSFQMGSRVGNGYDDEHPQHRVSLASFWLGKYPVTHAQWQAVMGKHVSRFNGERVPMDNISWKDALQFCQKLSKKVGRAFRLPSETEWEYACRAGTMTPFYFGETITTEVANYNGEFVFGAEPRGVYRHVPLETGSFPPNAFGLSEMHGTLWEWCADVWHENYEGAPTDNHAWRHGGEQGYSVARGGSWHDIPDVCRSAARLRYAVNDGDEIMGFRVACDNPI